METFKGDGGGVMGSIKGKIIEKGGVNISTVSGNFSKKMQKRIPGAENDSSYWATGISVVLHPNSPHIPSMHFNSRFLSTTKFWFGGVDITPCGNYEEESKYFHDELKKFVINMIKCIMINIKNYVTNIFF